MVTNRALTAAFVLSLCAAGPILAAWQPGNAGFTYSNNSSHNYKIGNDLGSCDYEMWTNGDWDSTREDWVGGDTIYGNAWADAEVEGASEEADFYGTVFRTYNYTAPGAYAACTEHDTAEADKDGAGIATSEAGGANATAGAKGDTETDSAVHALNPGSLGSAIATSHITAYAGAGYNNNAGQFSNAMPYVNFGDAVEVP